jgi:hypothetical protein
MVKVSSSHPRKLAKVLANEVYLLAEDEVVICDRPVVDYHM